MTPKIPSWLRGRRAGRWGNDAGDEPDEFGMPWTAGFAQLLPPAPTGERPAEAAAGEMAIADALGRLCQTFDRIAEGLEADRHERRMQLASLERLLRDVVTGIAAPTAVPPIIVGGSMSPDAHAEPPGPEVHIDLSASPLDVPRRARRQ